MDTANLLDICGRTHDDRLAVLADPQIQQRTDDDFRANATDVSHGDGNDGEFVHF